MKEQKSFSLGPMPISELRFLPWEQVAQCADEIEAIQLAWQCRRPRCSVEAGADRMGVSKGTLSKYLHGSLGLSPDRQRAFENVVSNRAVTQYSAYRSGCLLTPRQLTDAEKMQAENAAMKAELARLRGEDMEAVA